MAHIYKFVIGLGGGNAIFAAKAGVLSGKLRFNRRTYLYVDVSFVVLLCLPSFLKSSAPFAYGSYFAF